MSATAQVFLAAAIAVMSLVLAPVLEWLIKGLLMLIATVIGYPLLLLYWAGVPADRRIHARPARH